MSKYLTSKLRITSSFDQFQATRDSALRNVLESLEQMFATANALGVDNLPDNPSRQLQAAFSRADFAASRTLELITDKLQAMHDAEREQGGKPNA